MGRGGEEGKGLGLDPGRCGGGVGGVRPRRVRLECGAALLHLHADSDAIIWGGAWESDSWPAWRPCGAAGARTTACAMRGPGRPVWC
jgi:hypothetical protein